MAFPVDESSNNSSKMDYHAFYFYPPESVKTENQLGIFAQHHSAQNRSSHMETMGPMFYVQNNPQLLNKITLPSQYKKDANFNYLT